MRPSRLPVTCPNGPVVPLELSTPPRSTVCESKALYMSPRIFSVKTFCKKQYSYQNEISQLNLCPGPRTTPGDAVPWTLAGGMTKALVLKYSANVRLEWGKFQDSATYPGFRARYRGHNRWLDYRFR